MIANRCIRMRRSLGQGASTLPREDAARLPVTLQQPDLSHPDEIMSVALGRTLAGLDLHANTERGELLK